MTERRYLQPHVRSRYGKQDASEVEALQARYDRMGVEAAEISTRAYAEPTAIERIRRLIWLYEFLMRREDLAVQVDALLAKHHR